MVRRNPSLDRQLHDPNVGILNNTRTMLGRDLLREWLLRPSLSLPVIAARHVAVACFVNADNMTTADDVQGHLSGIKNMPRILRMLKSGKAKVKDWQGVVEVGPRLSLSRALGWLTSHSSPFMLRWSVTRWQS